MKKINEIKGLNVRKFIFSYIHIIYFINLPKFHPLYSKEN